MAVRGSGEVYLVVVYREVITAYVTERLRRRDILWTR